MTSIGVNSLDGLFANQVQVKGNVKATENFNDTLKGVTESEKQPKVESVKAESAEKTETSEFEDDKTSKVSKFESAKKREMVKQKEEPTEEQMCAAMEEVINQIKEFIVDKFGVSEEELESTMMDLEISDVQLLDANALTKLVMKLDKVELPSDVLTNPEFSKDLKELLNQVEQIKNENLGSDKVTEYVPELEAKEVDLETTEHMEVEVDTETVVEEAVVEDEDVQVEENVVDDEEVQVEENNIVQKEVVTTENFEGEANQQMEHKNDKPEKMEVEDTVNINAVRPEDFAARLTEDLSAKVGERQAITIVRQVVEQVSMQTKQGMTTMELQLYPAHLGRVVVQLVSKDGNVTAQITAETEAAKNALEGQLTLLKENLVNQGVRIENVEVTIASHAFEQNMQGEKQSDEQPGGKNHGRRAARILDEGLNIEAEEAPEIIDVMGNTVSYSA